MVEHPNPNVPNWYNIEDTPIRVGWKRFQPKVETDTYKAVIHIPGYGYRENTQTIIPLCQTLADYSQTQTLAIDTYTHRNHNHSLKLEAKAAYQFIKDSKLKEVIVTGGSQGGSQAMHLTSLLQNEIDVKGLILFDSVGLHNRSLDDFFLNYAKELVTKQAYPSHMNRSVLETRGKIARTEGLAEIYQQIALAGGLLHWPQRILEEIRELLTINSSAKDIKVPVVIIQGAKDNMAHPKRIIPKGKSYIRDIKEREEFLRKNIFPNSPSIRMLVGEKMGNHGLPSSRAELVARVSLRLLHHQIPPKIV